MVAEGARERRSKLRMQERASQAGETGGRNHPKVSSSDDVTDKLKTPQPKHDTRAEIARSVELSRNRRRGS